MKFDAKKHDILVVKIRLASDTSLNRELTTVKSGDDLNSLLRIVPWQYHDCITDSRECVVTIKWCQVLPTRRVYATTEIAVRMPRHRKWKIVTPPGVSFITSMRDSTVIWTDEDAPEGVKPIRDRYDPRIDVPDEEG